MAARAGAGRGRRGERGPPRHPARGACAGDRARAPRGPRSPAALPAGRADDGDTVVAVATAPGGGGAVAVVRVSGPGAEALGGAVFRPGPLRSLGGDGAGGASPAPPNMASHRFYYGHVFDAKGRPVDEALCVLFRGPRSFTAEDVLEIHTHGGHICAQRVLSTVLEAGDGLERAVRRARPGEFTMRAFLNGRLDLAQAEGVAALVAARTPAAADAALAGVAGAASAACAELRGELLDVLADVEARIDFESDLGPNDAVQSAARARALRLKAESLSSGAARGVKLTQGLTAAIVGPPNAGKSSLLNALAGTDRALVSPEAGTTRDTVDVTLNLDGYPVTLVDTAGLRGLAGSSEEPGAPEVGAVEKAGVDRAGAAARAADALVFVLAGDQGWGRSESRALSWAASPVAGEAALAENGFQKAAELLRLAQRGVLVVNKSDLEEAQHEVPEEVQRAFRAVVKTSCVDESGLDELTAALLEAAGAGGGDEGGAYALDTFQCDALDRATGALSALEAAITEGWPADCWGVHLRESIQALDEVTGRDTTEDVLSTIFSKFCIGK